MENIILFDDENWSKLLPMTYTRPVSELRVGILTIQEKWRRWLDAEISYITQDYLAEKYPIKIKSNNLIINSSLLPNEKICHLISQLDNDEALLQGDELIAARMQASQFELLTKDLPIHELKGMDINNQTELVDRISHPNDILEYTAQEIEKDFQLLTDKRSSAPIHESVQVFSPGNIFIEEGAKIRASVINADNGPVYIDKNAEVMEGCLIRGPFSLGEGSIVKMGSKIYGPTSIGPYSKVGGEIKNSVVSSYSNKSHDGFLGNSVLGSWCNLGAGTNNSNLKNNYSEVKLWDYTTNSFKPIGTQFFGLVMGDHSKCGIDTMFNTGTVIGVFANIFGSGYPRNFIPSFSWGGASGFTTYNLRKALEVSETVMSRRNKALSDLDRKILGHVYHNTARYRVWEP